MQRKGSSVLGWGGWKEVVGWRTQVGGSLACLLAAEWRRNAGPSLYQFLRAFVVALVITVIIWCVLWWPSFFLYLYAHICQVGTITGVLTPLHASVQGKLKWGVSADLWLALVSCVRDSFGQVKCLPIFLLRRGGWCVCDEFVCACAHTLAHTRCIWNIQMWAQASGWDTWRAVKKIRYEKLWQTCTLKWRFSRTRRFSRTTRKEKHVLSIDNFFCWLSLYPSSLQQRFAPATVNRKRIRDPIKTNKTNNKFVPCDFLRIDECHWITHFSFLF